MVKSNIITITVKEAEGKVTYNHITAEKTEVVEGESVHFTGVVKGYIPSLEWHIWIRVFVDGAEKASFDIYPKESGEFEETYEFDITFDRKGTYDVYTEALAQLTHYE